jgi:hypothetical protein
LPFPGSDTYIVDDPAAQDLEGVVVHEPNGTTTVLPNPPDSGKTLVSGPNGPQWSPIPAAIVGVPVYVQAGEPENPPTPSLWIPLDGNGDPVPTNQWQVFV